MSSKIRESKLIPYSIQGGDGYPTHISPIGSLYFDNLTSLFYQNLDGINTWASIYGSGNIPFDIYVTGGTYDSTHGIATFINNSGFSFTVTGFTSGGSSVFSGGTITGATNFTGGLTANTFSATTYEGLPLDIHLTGLTFDNSTYNITVSQNDGSQYTQNLSILSSDVTITGGTYNPTTGVASFTNNTGGTFNVTGFLTGHTDTYVTGMTFNNNILTLYQTQGNASISQILNNLSGLTVSGNVVANSISATTYQNLPSDIFVTGGTPNNSTRSYTFINSTGGTFNLLGLLDVTTTGGTYNNGAIQFINSTGGTFNVTGLYTGYTPTQDIFVTGGTYSAGTAIFANNTGGTFSVSGFNVSTSFTGGTVSGATNFISGLTANTIYATTFSGGSFYGNGSGLTGITGTGLSPISVTGTTLFSNNPLTNNFNLNNSIFFGQNAGYGATGAYNSNFFGQNAGYGATGASLANFFGYQAGQGATGASYSNFIGSNAGQGATNAGQSNFLGYQAGYTATNATNSNFFGQNAGQNASGASQANFFGYYAGYGATGAFASNFFGNASGQNATGASGSNFFGQNAGQNAYNAQNSNFLGGGAGQGATGATYSNFFGQNAGQNASGASQANFFGYQAGQNAYNASNSNFFGQNAGNGATGASLANFFGYQTGQNAYNAQFSNFIGYNAGSGATNASYSNFFGNGAGQGATGASYSNLIGYQAGYGATIGSNNIIIGTNISLPAATSNAINLGGVLFGTNTYSTTFGSPATGATATGSIGIGIVTPTARFQLPSGTTAATSAPLKFTSGATLTIPEAGAVEYDGTYLYLTPNSGLRNIIGSVASNMGNIIFVSPLGSDSTGLKYNITAPYKTITAALTAATTGDTIYVMAGTYTDTNLWKDGVNYYFQNGSILSPTSAITIFNINGTGQTNDWAIDGFLTVNTAQNASVFSFNQINTTSRFDIKFKSILATNITGTKNLIQLSSSGSSIATYSIQGDIKVTSALNNNYAALNINGSSANIYYLGNITMTSTSTAILVNNDNNGNKYFNGNFSSQGAPTTISLAPGGAITTVNGSIYNSSVASGVYAIISSSNYTNININASIIGNVSLVGAGVQSLDGIVQGVSNNAPATIVLNGGFNNLNLSTSHCSLYIQNGTNTIQGNYTLACGSFSNIGSLHQIGGTTYWKGYSSYPNGGSGALSNPNIISGGTFVITKGSVITVTDNNNGSGSATQFGLYLYTGGTLINEGVINYSTTGSTGTNLGSILLSGGLLQLDGGRIINNQTANSACSISAVTNSNILVYGNAYVNKGTSGGTLTNLVTGGGSIYTYTGMTF